MNRIEEIKRQKKDGKKIIIFCAGLHGILFYNVLKVCGIAVDFFSDSDRSKWEKTVVEDIICVSPEKIKCYDCMGFICVRKACYKEIYAWVCREKLFEIIEISYIIDGLILNNRKLYFDSLRSHAKQKSADIFYDLYPNKKSVKGDTLNFGINKGKEKIAVYTAVFGGYDTMCVSQCLNDNTDYFYLSDIKPRELPEYYHWIDAGNIIPDYITSPIKRNRFIKMHPHLFLKNYTYSIYIDGNVRIKSDLSNFLTKSRTGISVFMHPMRECIYYEALSIVNFKRVDVEDVCKQMNKYFEEGMPYRYGLAEMPVIVREHMKKECMDVMATWWKEFNSESQRDQLSFMYALWKNKFCLDDLGCLGNNVRNCDEIEFCKHISESRNVKNEKMNT